MFIWCCITNTPPFLQAIIIVIQWFHSHHGKQESIDQGAWDRTGSTHHIIWWKQTGNPIWFESHHTVKKEQNKNWGKGTNPTINYSQVTRGGNKTKVNRRLQTENNGGMMTGTMQMKMKVIKKTLQSTTRDNWDWKCQEQCWIYITAH
jgi:hypothetical protein